MSFNQGNSQQFSYRKEIDGLRAIAVIPVILFHAGFESFSGGFVGVDIFFVISGYLITSIILIELRRGEFTLSGFYERRARRILPALFLVMFACLPFAWFWLLPSDLKDFGESLVAVTVSASNILFWSESGYFAPSADLKPLLHTWSLAVEEQFYILFPLLLMFAYRYGKKRILLALGIALAGSLLLSHWGTTTKPAATFYLLPTRGWELLLGALAALHLINRPQESAPSHAGQAGGLIGLVLIFYAILFYDQNTPFPGLFALVPTIGTMLVILFANKHTLAGQILGTNTLIGIGLLSYSAYLWHQPLFAFYRHQSTDRIGAFEAGFLILAIFLLAYLTWKHLELPFRDKRRTSKRIVILSSLGGLIFFFAFGLIIAASDGKVGKLGSDAKYEDLQHRLRGNYGLHQLCETEISDRTECKTAINPEIMLWGDSYAMHLAEGIKASDPDVRLIQATVSQCAPLLDLAPAGAIHGARSCIESNDRAMELLDRYKSIKYVVLSSPSFLLTQSSIATKDNGVKHLDKEEIEAQLLKTIRTLESRGIAPVIFSPPPANGKDFGQCLLRAEMLGKEKTQCNFREFEAEGHQKVVLDALKRLERLGYKVIWLSDGICKSGDCEAFQQDNFIYRDSGHLSYEGSSFLGRKMNFYKLITNNEVY